jgi:DNA mismatch repair protein MutS2
VQDLEAVAPSELMLIGKRVEEGLEELDRFLDEAAVAGLGEVRVVHGHGTGRLRKAVRAFLTRHPHVRRHRQGKPGEGGDGATVVTLR